MSVEAQIDSKILIIPDALLKILTLSPLHTHSTSFRNIIFISFQFSPFNISREYRKTHSVSDTTPIKSK